MDLSGPELTVGLSGLIGPDRVLSGPAIWKTYECDAYSIDRSPPAAVVLPETTAEVSALLRWCHDRQVPVTPRGAGTGLSGGSMPALGGVVVSTKRMTAILETDLENRRLHVQTGLANLKVTRHVEAAGLHFAPDPSSQSVSTVGGNIGENSGGPHTLKYGTTTQHVLGITMVMGDGEVVQIGGKGGCGGGYDLLSLVVGSEGTLGLVTEAWLRLTPLPAAVRTATACFESVRAASEAVAGVIRSGVVPSALEMMDRNVLDAVARAYPITYPDRTMALLLIECDGGPVESGLEMDLCLEVCRQNGCVEVQVAENEADRARLWTARKKGIGAMGRLAPTVVTHDGVIPPSRLPDMLDFVYEVAGRHGIGVANIFHAGDGNLHPIFYFDERDAGVVEKVVSAGEEIIGKCLELGGSVSGEHGIGVEKTGMLAKMFDAPSILLQKRVREIFEAGPCMNPCKVVPDAKGCVEHRSRWRGVAT